jgi:hypothetical protein
MGRGPGRKLSNWDLYLDGLINTGFVEVLEIETPLHGKFKILGGSF